jgi:hypothetical protein
LGLAAAIALALAGLVLPMPGTAPAIAGGASGISGNVTIAGGGAALDGYVEVFDGSKTYLTNVSADGAGHYSVTGLTAGTYYLWFGGFTGAVDEWYDNATGLDDATPVVTTPGATATINIQLAVAGQISGTVSMDGGGSAGVGTVYVYSSVGSVVTSQTTDSGGNYTVEGLAAGNYFVRFLGFTGAASEYYDDAASLAGATSVHVTAGLTTPVNGHLAAQGIISGTVTMDGGGAAANGCVYVYTPTGAWVDSTCTISGSGGYSVRGLRAGTYRVYFISFEWTVNEYYNNAATLEAAADVVVTAGGTTTVNASLALAGTISGTVTKDGGGPALGGCVYAYDAGGAYVSSGCTQDTHNTYTILALTAGTYHLRFEGFDGAQDEWYHDATDFASSTPVVVTNHATTTVNASLASGPGYGGTGSIAGTVTAPSGYLPTDLDVSLYTDSWNWIDTLTPASNGTYLYAGLNNGAYRVCFDSDNSELSCVDAVVAGGGATTGVDGAFASWRTIHISAVLHSSLNSVCADLVYLAGSAPYGWYTNCTPTSGTATADANYLVPAGSYLVGAYEQGTYPARTDELWWNNTSANKALRSNATAYVALATKGGSPAATFSFAAMPYLGHTSSTVSLTSPMAPVSAGQNVSLTALVSGSSGTPTGVLGFDNDANFIGDATLSGGVAAVPYTVPAPMVTSVHMSYRGDSVYAPHDAYAYLNYLPSITSLSPGFGPTAGGTTVTLTGSAFWGTSDVTFDGVSGTGVTVYSEGTLTVTTPPGTSPNAAVVVTNGVGDSLPVTASFFAYTDSSVVAASPVRILDTSGFTPGVVRCYPVVGLANVPDGATGVLLNVTTVGPSGNGYVVIYPDTDGTGATPAPLASTVNFEPGRDVANSAIVALADHDVCAYSAGGTLSRLVLDVAGYIVPGSGITIQSAQRLLDTRQAAQQVSGPVPPMTVENVQVTGHAGVPSGATAVVANVTVVGPTAPGHLRAWAAGAPVPNTSVVNYAPGQTKANGQIIALSPSGALSFESFTGPGTATNPVQVIIDVVGYVEAGSVYRATDPTRIVETRASAGVVGPIPGPLVPNSVYPVTLTDTSLVPSDATAVVLNVTAVSPTAFGNLRVYPDTNGLGTTTPPNSSVVNYIPGRAIPNMVIVQIPPDRKIDFYNNQGASSSRTDLVVDVIGYISAPPI